MTVSSLPAARPAFAPGWTGAIWATAGLLAAAFLPWSRTGRGLFEGGSSLLGLLGERSLLILPLLTLLALLALSAVPRSRRAWPQVALAAVGFVAAFADVALSGRAIDAGAIAVLLALASLAGIGLADSGAIRADAFVGGSLVWSCLLIFAFIVFPLWRVLRASFGASGITLEHFAAVFSSPAFFMLENTATPLSESRVSLVATGVGLLLGLGLALWQRRRLGRVLLYGLLGAVLVGGLTALWLGFGALRNSLLMAVVVGFTSTALGLGFALLGARSRVPIAPYVGLPLVGGLAALGAFLGVSPVLGFLPSPLPALLGGLIGLVLTFAMWRARWTVSRLMGVFSVLPMITPPFVIGFALIFLLGRQGVITKGLFGLDTDFFLGELAVAVAQTLAFTPIAYLVLVGVVDGLDASLEEAAQTLGASRWHLLRTVVWPLVRPGLANAFLLGAIESLADFGNPFVLGGSFLATETFMAVEFSPGEAAVYGTILLAISLGVFALQRRWVGSLSYVTVTGKPSGGRASPLPAWLDHGLLAVFTIWMAFTAVLYGSIVYGSFVKLWGFNGEFTFEHILNLERGSMDIFLGTLKVSAWSAIPTAILGFVIAYLVSRQRFVGRTLLEAGSLLSFAVPGTVMGIGYILAFNDGPLYVTQTALILALAFIFRNMPVGIRSSVAALKQIDPALEEASTTLRAPSSVTLWRVVVPLVRPALLSGLIFAFVRAVTAISQVIFLISPDNRLITTEVLGMVERGQLGDAAALSALLVITMGAVIALLFVLSRLLGGRAAPTVQGAP